LHKSTSPSRIHLERAEERVEGMGPVKREKKGGGRGEGEIRGGGE
jgi:hypothetical protein